MIAPSILAGTSSRAEVSDEWIKATSVATGVAELVTAVGGPLGLGAGIFGAAATSSWLMKAFTSGKTKPSSKEKKDEK